MTGRAKRWSPPGPVAGRFVGASRFYKYIQGPIGSGKSSACVAELMSRAVRQRPGPDGKRRVRFAVIRNSYPQLETTTVKTWQEWTSPDQGKWTFASPIRWEMSTPDLEIEVLFLALDKPEDTKKLLSLELSAAWINEAREVPKEILDALSGRVNRYPSMADGGATVPGVILDSNPPSEDHWLAKIIEVPPEDWGVFVQPSGLSPEAENVDNLPPGYYEKVASGKSDTWRQVYVEGRPGTLIAGRPVFPEFSRAIHCVDEPPAPVPGVPIRLGVDFGLTPAAVLTQKLGDGRWVALGEIVTPPDEQMGAAAFGELVASILDDWLDDRMQVWCFGDPAGHQKSQADEKRAMLAFSEAARLDCRPAPTNSFVERRESVAAVLSKLIGGRPAFQVSPQACPVLVRGLAGGYAFRRVHTPEGGRDIAVPNKSHYSHVCDALQYAIVSSDSLAAKRRAQRQAGGQQVRGLGSPTEAIQYG